MKQTDKDNRSFGIDAGMLRLLAILFMLLDHLWATVVSGNLWRTCVGRLAFPIFAFQIAEGFFRTSDCKKYLRRLLLFALISEIPFNLVMGGSWLFPFHQNVLWTLALGLWAVMALDKARRSGNRRDVAAAVLTVAAALGLSVVGFTDYGLAGVLTVLLFYAARDFRGAWLCRLAGMVLINCVLIQGQTLPALWDFPIQGFAVLALIPIGLYDGRQGRGGKVMKWLGYWFYPVHLAVLGLLWLAG